MTDQMGMNVADAKAFLAKMDERMDTGVDMIAMLISSYRDGVDNHRSICGLPRPGSGDPGSCENEDNAGVLWVQRHLDKGAEMSREAGMDEAQIRSSRDELLSVAIMVLSKVAPNLRKPR